ncbi:hypothetical protein [Acidovorax sp. HMWF018]|uniref:hypothetical protein n=1 Tax=Acidovorax sp. HMWF018 TaxID=2056855 RepID=UPI0011B25083|nr:hypothetical protein [Acidovorax sp. HMWF018]
MEQATEQAATATSKPTNWYSGWRVFATAATTFIAAKLFGVAGALVAVLLFLWLQPKRGTWQALAAAVAAGALVAVGLSVALLQEQRTNVQQAPASPQPAATPISSEKKAFTYEEAVGGSKP